MNKLNRQFKGLKQESAPRAEFKARLWVRIDAELPQGVKRHTWGGRLRLSVGMAVVIILLSGTTGTYAYSSPSVTPTSPLYGIKTGIERVRESFCGSHTRCAEFHEKIAHRRKAELDRVDDDDARGEVLERLMDAVELSEYRAEQAQETYEVIRVRVQRLRDDHIEEAQGYLIRRLDRAIESGDITHDSAEEYRQQIREGRRPQMLRHRPPRPVLMRQVVR